MNNFFDQGGQDPNQKPVTDAENAANRENSFNPSVIRQEESNMNSEHTAPQKPTNAELVPDNTPGISQFLKAEVGRVDRESPEPDAVNAASVVQGVGHMLRNERLNRKMSVEDVSRQLRISPHQVEAIEKEDFDALPGRTFMRGFVRNYANLMQLDANAVLKMLPGSAAVVTRVEHTPFKIQEMKSSSRESGSGGSLLQIIIVLAALAGVGYFLYDKMPFWGRDGEAGEQDVIVQKSGDSDTVEMSLALPLPSLKLPTSPGGATQLSTGASNNSSTSIVTQNPITNLNTIGTLVFTFAADTRVKVTDGNDDIIFEQNNIRGTQQRVSGKRPFSVVIDNASAVELNYNDRAIDIKPYTHPTKGSANLMLE